MASNSPRLSPQRHIEGRSRPVNRPPPSGLGERASASLGLEDMIKLLGPSPENAISDNVGPVRINTAVPSAVSSTFPVMVVSGISQVEGSLRSPQDGGTAAGAAQGPTFQSTAPRVLSWGRGASGVISQEPATGIFRKLVDVWRVQPYASGDEEAANGLLAAGEIHVMEIRRDWDQVTTDEEQACVLKIVNGVNGHLSTGSKNHILWIHSKSSPMTTNGFKMIIAKHGTRDLSKGEIDLIPSLLRRVQIDAERQYIHGSLLNPVVRRYDGLGVDTKDKPIMFINFPFISLQQVGPGADPETRNWRSRYRLTGKFPYVSKRLDTFPERDTSAHQDRTLLQSRYRLQSTRGRDGRQSITKLSVDDVRTCIDASDQEKARLFNTGTPELLHVPQLWAVISRNGSLVTMSTLGVDALQGPTIKTKITGGIPENKPSVVEITLEQGETNQGFIYPIEQCSSWIGLLNKELQILKWLKDRNTAVADDYGFYTTEDVNVTRRTWVNILRSERSEKVTLWMKRATPRNEVTEPVEDTSSNSAGEEAQGVSGGTGVPDRGSIANDHGSVGATSDLGQFFAVDVNVKPLLEWPIVDRFGVIDPQPAAQRVNRFLNDIRTNLLRGFQPPAGANQSVQLGERSHPRNTGIEHLLPGKTLNEVQTDPQGAEAPNTDIEHSLRHAFRQLCLRLLLVFVSAPITSSNHQVIKMFWGAVNIILSQSDISLLQCFIQELNPICALLNDLRFDLDCFITNTDDAGQAGAATAPTSPRAILLLATVDAFQAILCVFLLSGLLLTQRLWSTPTPGNQAHLEESSVVNLRTLLQPQVRASITLLETVRDQLTIEQGGDNHNVGLGPVVTPESILLLTLSRLSRGVFQSGSIDVLDLQHKYLEKLTLEVEEKASRRLLQELGRFSEEVEIVVGVMKQQCDILNDVRYKLNPASFSDPSLSRQISFEYESKFIDRLILSIHQRICNYEELSDRVSKLTVEDVHLVETQQDENSKNIFVFTIVTIIFLPLTFVSGFFGMNLSGISGTTSTAVHFWEVAVPVTGVVCIFLLLVVFWRKWFPRKEGHRKKA